MKISGIFDKALKLSLIVAAVYLFMNWQSLAPSTDDVAEFAEQACIDAITRKYETTRVSAYSTDTNSKGYVVKASATMAKGGNAKVSCVTNALGGVEDLLIEERQ